MRGCEICLSYMDLLQSYSKIKKKILQEVAFIVNFGLIKCGQIFMIQRKKFGVHFSTFASQVQETGSKMPLEINWRPEVGKKVEE